MDETETTLKPETKTDRRSVAMAMTPAAAGRGGPTRSRPALLADGLPSRRQ
jgi:hypothetical protein